MAVMESRTAIGLKDQSLLENVEKILEVALNRMSHKE